MYFAARMDNSAESWIDTNSLEDESRPVQYLWSLFMALSHMLCIGYGPPGSPGTITELSMTIMSMLIGASLYVILIGLITANLMTFKDNTTATSSAKDTHEKTPSESIPEAMKGNLKKTPPTCSDSNHTTPCSSRRSSLNMAQLNNLSHHVLLLVASALSSGPDMVSASPTFGNLRSLSTTPAAGHHHIMSTNLSTFEGEYSSFAKEQDCLKMFLMNKDKKNFESMQKTTDMCSRLTCRRSSI